MTLEPVFECKQCGECCRGEGGIFILVEEAAGPASLLGISAAEFVERYTEPRHGRLSIKTDGDWCLMHDRATHLCRIHVHKPRMCRDWPCFHGMLDSRQGFEDAKNACPGFRPDASWEEFLEWSRDNVKELPPRSYIFDDARSVAVPVRPAKKD